MENISTPAPEIVKKENISEFSFMETEVLNDPYEIKKRRDNLYRAMILGNAYHRKVKILFETSNGPKQVETTIWATTEKNIILKGGVVIPVNAIKEVNVY